MGNTVSAKRRFALPKQRLSSQKRSKSSKLGTPPPSGLPAENKSCPGPPNIAPPPTPQNPPKPEPIVVVALYDYSPRTEGDLTFKKDDRLLVLDKQNGDWWKAKNTASHQEGFIPRNYVAEESTLEAQKWFFGMFRRVEAERLLTQCSQHASFIVRESETNPNDYSLSVFDHSTVKHYRIRTSGGLFYITHKVKFTTIQQLIHHYSTKDDGLCVRLGHPPIKGQSSPQTFSLTHSTQDEWEIPRSSIKLIKCLGEGHYGQVWQGEYNGTMNVAVKQLKKGAMTREEFLKEATVMKSLRHNKLVQLFAVCTKEEPIFIIEELMSQCLNKYLQEQTTQDKTSLKDLTNMAAQVAAGMQYLESKNYIHRDLAARNVLVKTTNNIVECKIADFGLARVLHNHDRIYEAQNVLHFPVKWTAPEAATHMKFTIKSDVWSFGILMYEIFTFGGTPYPGMSNQETLSQVEKGYRMSCPSIMTPELYDIMLSCWKATPADRPTFETVQWRLEDYYYNDEAGQLGYKDAESTGA